MGDANQDLFDGALRHQIDLRRYDGQLRKSILALLEVADAKLAERLRTILPRVLGRPVNLAGDKWKSILSEVREARAEVLGEVQKLAKKELNQLAQVEADHELKLLAKASPVEYKFASATAEALGSIVTSKPFQGAVLGDWFKSLAAADQTRLVRTLQLGAATGDTTDNIVRKIVGTKSNQFADGILTATRREAQAIVRTGLTHTSTQARELVWEANSDVIELLVIVATLDGRTTAICRARDGQGVALDGKPLPSGILPLDPPGVRPPFHVGCRSTMVAVFRGMGLLGGRPTVVDTRTRERREIDFKAQAKQTGKSLPEIRADWAAQNVGRVPSTTSYQDFLSRQSAKFQDEVLGKTKGKLFREGNLKLDQFVDRAGNELTLAQLAERSPEAFRSAGMDPDIFVK